MRPEARVEVRDCVIQFRKELLPALAVHVPELGALLPLLDRAHCGIEFRGDVLAGVEARFDEIIDDEGPGRVGLLIEFLSRLSRERDYRLLSTNPTLVEDELAALETLDRVVRQIAEHHGVDVRVAHACELLSASERSITEIGYEVGYNNIANFNRRFRELKRLTPREYRKRSRTGHRTASVDLLRGSALRS